MCISISYGREENSRSHCMVGSDLAGDGRPRDKIGSCLASCPPIRLQVVARSSSGILKKIKPHIYRHQFLSLSLSLSLSLTLSLSLSLLYSCFSFGVQVTQSHRLALLS